jgi:hypothetical protein
MKNKDFFVKKINLILFNYNKELRKIKKLIEAENKETMVIKAFNKILMKANVFYGRN